VAVIITLDTVAGSQDGDNSDTDRLRAGQRSGASRIARLSELLGKGERP
jgi:hypothetical protein